MPEPSETPRQQPQETSGTQQDAPGSQTQPVAQTSRQPSRVPSGTSSASAEQQSAKSATLTAPDTPRDTDQAQDDLFPAHANAGALLEMLESESPSGRTESGLASTRQSLPVQPSLSTAISQRLTRSDAYSQVTHESGVVVLHVQAGSEYQALLYLLRSVCRHFRMDDVLPDVPPEIAEYNYLLLSSPVGLPDGDAATLFEHPTHPRGLLLSRTHAPAPRNGQTTTDGTPRFNPDAIDRAGQTRLLFGGIVTQRVLDKMSSNASSARTSLAGTPGHLQSTPRGGTQDAAQGQAGLAGLQGQVASRLGGRRVRPELDKFSFITRVTARQARSWRRQAAESRLAKLPQKTRLVPVALPAHAGFLQMAAEAIIAFNKRGLQLTPYLDKTCLAAAAASRIQAAFRAHHFRQVFQAERRKIEARAARVIQRAWRAHLNRCRVRMLRQLRDMSRALDPLLLGESLAVTVGCADLLRACAAVPVTLFREHTIQFAFTPEGQVIQVAPSDLIRPGLPMWTAVTQTVMRTEQVEEAHGPRPLYTQQEAVLLLTQGATWKTADGVEIPREQGLPPPPPNAKQSDVLMQVVFKSPKEARARAALLLTLTWDPATEEGCLLQPPHHTSMARSMPSTPRSQADALSHTAMHKWASLKSQLSAHAGWESLPGSAVHSIVSCSPIPDWSSRLPSPSRTSPAVSRPISRGLDPTLSRAPSRGASRGQDASAPLQDIATIASRPSSRASPGGVAGVIKSPHRQVASPPTGATRPPVSRTSSQPAGSAASAARATAPGKTAHSSSKGAGNLADAPVASPSLEFEFRPATAQAELQRQTGLDGVGSPRDTDVPQAGPRPNSVAATLESMSDQLSAAARVPPLQLQQQSPRRHDSNAPGSPGRTSSPRSPREEATRAGSPGRDAPQDAASPALSPVRPPSADEARAIQAQLFARRPQSSRQHSPRPGTEGTIEYNSRCQTSKTTASRSTGGHLEAHPELSFTHITHHHAASTDIHAIGPWQNDSEVSLPPNHPDYPSLPTSPSLDLIHGLDEYGRPKRLTLVLAAQGAGTGLGSPRGQQQGPSRRPSQAGNVSSPRTARQRAASGVAAAQSGSCASPARLLAVPRPAEKAPAVAVAADSNMDTPRITWSTSEGDAQGVTHSHSVTTQSHTMTSPQGVTYPHGLPQDTSTGTHTSTVPMQTAMQTSARLHHNIREDRAQPREHSLHKDDIRRVRQALGIRNTMLQTGGPDTIARVMPGRVPPGAILAPLKLLQSWPWGGNSGGGGYGAGSEAVMGVGGEGLDPVVVGEHTVAKAAILNVAPTSVAAAYMPHVLDELQAKQAMLQRAHSYATEERLLAARDAHLASMQDRVASVKAPGLVWVKHTSTGHVFAPDYVPLSPVEMTKLISEMRAVYQAAAKQQVAEQRKEHTEVMQDIALERKRVHQELVHTTHRQTAVLKTVKKTYEDKWHQAAQTRVTQRLTGEWRRRRGHRERAFAAAFVRQAGLLSRHVQQGERQVLRNVEAAEQWRATVEHREEREARDENISNNYADMVALKKWKAAAVRSTGYTQEIRDYQEAADAYNRDVVALRRLEDIARSQRVGCSGGVWGAARPRESLREPLPLSTVVSAADAKRHRKLAKQQAALTAQRDAALAARRNERRANARAASPARVGDAGGGAVSLPPLPSPAAPAAPPSARRSRVASATSSRPYSGTGSYISGSDYTEGASEGGTYRPDSATTGANPYRIFSATSRIVHAVSEGSDIGGVDMLEGVCEDMSVCGHEGVCEGGVGSSDSESDMVDFLPELPFAKGARLLAAPRPTRPTGIIV